MEYEIGSDAIAINATEYCGLALGYMHYPEDETKEEDEDGRSAEETLLLANGAEYEVGVLFGHIFQLGLGAVEKPFACEAARADGDAGLIDIVAFAQRVVNNAQGDLDALAAGGAGGWNQKHS